MNYSFSFIKIFLISIFLLNNPLAADNKNEPFAEEGTEFWICFQQNFKDSKRPSQDKKLHLELFISSNYDTKVKVEIKKFNYIKEVS